MGIINRDLSLSEKRKEFVTLDTIVTGVTIPVAVAPWPALLEGIFIGAVGISGTPFVIPEVHRFIVGTGFTAFNGSTVIGGTLSLLDIGTSGIVSVSLIAGGVTLSANDVVVLRSGGSNAAVTYANVSVVLKCLQDIKSDFALT